MTNSLRRSFLRTSASLAAAPSLAGAISILYSQQARAVTNGQSDLVASPYGPVSPKRDLTTGLPILALPDGFEYKSFGWLGDPMTNGQLCRGAVDGMAVVRSRRVGRSTELTLVRNHESSTSSTQANQIAPIGGGVYDIGLGGTGTPSFSTGGTSTLVFRDGNWIEVRASLGGTRTNCAGGVTPWGTWLSCEEVGSDTISNGLKRHGYVFEVPADGVSDAVPIIGMGRFRHEAVAIDPTNGVVYQTDDDSGKSGFYRYIPTDTAGASGVKGRLGSLANGGTLQMAKVKGRNNVVLVNAPNARIGQVFELEWIDIANPDANRGTATPLDPAAATISNACGPFIQGWAQGGLRMNRGEGIWYHDGAMYIIDTSGNNGTGVLWELDLEAQTLECIYASPSATIGNMVDNVCVSPRGGILMCEDGGGTVAAAGQRIMGLTPAGDTYEFARNNCTLELPQVTAAGKDPRNAGDRRGAETAGVCFDPTGRFMFLNIYTPGITVAITGPWAKGNL
jgi:hypothetical protein